VQSAFNRMAGDLASMERERTMVLAGISHDLRTPLSRLRLAVEMSGADAAAAQGMNADIEEMDQVIGQFLDFARGDAEAREPVALDALADEVAAHFAKLGKPVRRTGTCGVTLPVARMALHRALMNLVDNALRHGGGEIEIAASRRDGDAVWKSSTGDRGSSGEVERLKRPFTRLDEARSGQGAGLASPSSSASRTPTAGASNRAARSRLAARLVLGAGTWRRHGLARVLAAISSVWGFNWVVLKIGGARRPVEFLAGASCSPRCLFGARCSSDGRCGSRTREVLVIGLLQTTALRRRLGARAAPWARPRCAQLHRCPSG
jgi:hypothetical protein